MRKLLALLLVMGLALPNGFGATSGVSRAGGSSGGSGDVTAASNFGTDNVLIKSDGTSKGVQATGITIADTTNNMSGVGTITGTGTLGDLELENANIIFAKTSDNIETLISNAAAGDTIVLPAATFTLTGANTITIAKSIRLIGQGKGKTIIASAGTTAYVIMDIDSSNVSIEGISFRSTTSESSQVTTLIGIGDTLTDTYTDIIFKDIELTAAGNGLQRAFVSVNSAFKAYNMDMNVSSANDDAVCMFLNNTAGLLTVAETNIYGGTCKTDNQGAGSATDESQGLRIAESAATVNHTINVYGMNIVSTESAAGNTSEAVSVSGDNYIVNIYRSYIAGTDTDVEQASSATVNLFQTVLKNNTISGTVSISGGYYMGSGVVVDVGTGYGMAKLDGSSGGCLMMRDTDDAGWTEVTYLNGTPTATTDADGVCDGV